MSDKFDKYMQDAMSQPALAVSDVKLTYYPYRDLFTKDVLMSVTIRGTVTDETGDQHLAVVRYGLNNVSNEYVFETWCRDRFFLGLDADSDGGLTAVEERIQKAIEKVPHRKQALYQAMKNEYGSTSLSTPSQSCEFWKIWRNSKNELICSHTYAFLRWLQENRPNFKQEMQTLYEAATEEPVAAGGDQMYEGLAEYFFRVPVLIEGDRGAGKTWLGREFSENNQFLLIEMGGHENVEAYDMLGCNVPYTAGQLVWKDGPLSEAFRAASKGVKTVLMLDELLRIPQRQLSVLLNAFSPTSKGTYKLRTSRLLGVEDGIGVEETLECPISNLCVIATTNVGSEYAVDEIDPALEERFIVHRKNSSSAQIKGILTAIAKAKDFNPKLVTATMDFYKKMGELKSRGLVHRLPTTRTLSRSFEWAVAPEDVARHLTKHVLLWVARSSEGDPVQEQMDAVKTLIDKCFVVTL